MDNEKIESVTPPVEAPRGATNGQQAPQEDGTGGSIMSFILEVVKFAVVAALIVAPIRIFIAQPFIVKGESMDTTFADGQYLIVDEITYYTHAPERGDVIIFKYPKDPSKYFIKRIIGLPGETVVIENGDVTIKTKENPLGYKLPEPYIQPENKSLDNLTRTLGEGEYFVMGDNRHNSLDSRAWGPLPRENIVGRTLVRLLPVNTFGLFPGKAHDDF